MASSKILIEPTTEEKSQGWLVFRWALKCVAHLIPEQWQAEKLTEIIPMYAISVDTCIREEAIQVLFRTMQDLPQSRFAVMRGILRILDDFNLLIHSYMHGVNVSQQRPPPNSLQRRPGKQVTCQLRQQCQGSVMAKAATGTIFVIPVTFHHG